MKENLACHMYQGQVKIGQMENQKNDLLRIWSHQSDQGCDVIIFPEMYLCGYPSEDLLLDEDYLSRAQRAFDQVVQGTSSGGSSVLLPHFYRDGGHLYNSVFLIQDGSICGRWDKRHLVNDRVYQEGRVFSSGSFSSFQPFIRKGLRVGVCLCEDLWHQDTLSHWYGQDCDFLIVPNASVYESGKQTARISAARRACLGGDMGLLYVNQVGGQDGMIFDGGSFAMDCQGHICHGFDFFQPQGQSVTWMGQQKQWHGSSLRPYQAPFPGGGHECSLSESDFFGLSGVEFKGIPGCNDSDDQKLSGWCDHSYRALVLGLRDYVEKNGFSRVLLGLSGGIDSALTGAIAVDALGGKALSCVMMPTLFTHSLSHDIFERSVARWGCVGQTFDIAPLFQEFQLLLKQAFDSSSPLSDQNLQARLRGLLLMGQSNTQGSLVLTTGNKSELAMGYCTLYGDMCGGLSVLSDVYKSQVYALSRWRNGLDDQTCSDYDFLGGSCGMIDEAAIQRAPSAELSAHQKDEDDLGSYDVLDRILYGLIDARMGEDDLLSQGHCAHVISRAKKGLNSSQYKRHQSALGLKVNWRCFGRGYCVPLTHG